MVVGSFLGTLYFVERTGGASTRTLAYTEITSAANPFRGDFGYHTAPALPEEGFGSVVAIVGTESGDVVVLRRAEEHADQFLAEVFDLRAQSLQWCNNGGPHRH